MDVLFGWVILHIKPNIMVNQKKKNILKRLVLKVSLYCDKKFPISITKTKFYLKSTLLFLSTKKY